MPRSFKGWAAVLGALAVGVFVGGSWPWGQAQEKRPAVAEGPAVQDDAYKPSRKAQERLDITQMEGGVTQVMIDFPNKTHPLRTTWRVQYAVERVATKSTPRENFVIRKAFFRPHPDAPEHQVLGMTHMAETLVCYSSGTRYYDIADHSGSLMRASDSDLGDIGYPLSKDRKIVAEVRDRGLDWKAGRNGNISRRGEELVLWGVLPASNYLYFVQFHFLDNGMVRGQLGSTGSNLHSGRDGTHMHLGLWRIDVDLAGPGNNSARLIRHREPFGHMHKSQQVTENFNGGFEGFADWKAEEFTVLRIVNTEVTNPVGNPISYDLLTPRTGLARHFGPGPGSSMPDETYLQHDYYVLPSVTDKKTGQPAEMDYTKLMTYIRQGRKIDKGNLVVWAVTSGHHIPRDEDLQGAKGSRQTCATNVLWSGWDLRPRDLHEQTPHYPPEAAKKKKEEPKKEIKADF
jgi:hypothetical protein